MSDADNNAGYVLYRYSPTLAGAVIFTVLFFCSACFHLYQVLRTRSWFFIPMFLGAFMEAIGYIGRAASSHDELALGPYILQVLMILLAPTLMAASIYMTLGRLIRLVHGDSYSLIRPTRLTKVFVFGDVFSFLLQSGGGGLMSSHSSTTVKLGQKIVVIGLFVQLAFFGFFVVVTIMFDRRMRTAGTAEGAELQEGAVKERWRTLLNMLYVGSVMILVRSVFRVVEYLQGNAGYLMRNEVWLYLFDAVLMIIVVVTFNVFHPYHVLSRAKGKSGGNYSLGAVQGE